jgi:hypothetical protein
MFKVMKDRCDQCLYGPDKIVSDRRRKQILNDLRKRDDWFVCHKATIAGQSVCCRGDFDQRGGGQLGRIAGRLGAVQFVDEATLEK